MWHVRPGLSEEGGPQAAQGDAAQQREASAQLPAHDRTLPGVSAPSPSPRSASSPAPPPPQPLLILDCIRYLDPETINICQIIHIIKNKVLTEFSFII